MDVHSKLKKLNKLDVELTQYQPDNLPNNLFENYLTHREEILDHYGLPYADEFTKLLELGNKVLTDYEIEAVVTKMRHAANSYLTSPVRTDLDELQNAYENKTTTFEVLPKIGIETHTYTIFIYNQYLLRGRDSIESINEIFQITKQGEILNKLGTLKATDEKTIEELEGIGLKYVREFADKSE